MLNTEPAEVLPGYPFTVKSTTDNASKLPSVSFFNTPFAALTFKVTSSFTEPVSGFPTGGKGEIGTVTVTIAVSVPPFPSEISYVNVSEPLLNPALGVYFIVPFAFIVAVPFDGFTVIALTTIVSPVSTSESLFNTGISIAIPGSVPEESSFATGLSLIGFTVTFNVEFAVFVPSLTV